MKPKSGFLTFCFAFIPGAGQMYLGHMKRGVSLCLLFCINIALADLLLGALGTLLPVIWMYCFFDTFNLHSQLLADTAPEDDYVVHFGHDESLDQLLEKRHRLVGWLLVALGVFAIYQNFIRWPLQNLLESLSLTFVGDMLDNLPALLVCIALILLGLWLVRGPKPTADDFAQDYRPNYAAQPSAAPVVHFTFPAGEAEQSESTADNREAHDEAEQ